MSDRNSSAPFEIQITCSIIGSFRKYYRDVVDLIEIFDTHQVLVLSPRVSTLINPDEWFVRLKSDDPLHSPEVIQLIALHRILRSDFVYVFCPGGYIGNTTSYEIGRIHERRIPLYYSEPPLDLPIAVAPSAVLDRNRLAQYIRQHHQPPIIQTTDIPAFVRDLDARLHRGEYVE